MRPSIAVLLVSVVLAGCKPEAAQPTQRPVVREPTLTDMQAALRDYMNRMRGVVGRLNDLGGQRELNEGLFNMNSFTQEILERGQCAQNGPGETVCAVLMRASVGRDSLIGGLMDGMGLSTTTTQEQCRFRSMSGAPGSWSFGGCIQR